MLPCGQCKFYDKKNFSCKKNCNVSCALDRWAFRDDFNIKHACFRFEQKKTKVLKSFNECFELLSLKISQLELDYGM